MGCISVADIRKMGLTIPKEFVTIERVTYGYRATYNRGIGTVEANSLSRFGKTRDKARNNLRYAMNALWRDGKLCDKEFPSVCCQTGIHPPVE